VIWTEDAIWIVWDVDWREEIVGLGVAQGCGYGIYR